MAKKLPNLVGVSGTHGAGKDVLAQLLVRRAGYTHISLSDILRAELTQRGTEHSRSNLSALSQSIRQAEGDGAMVERLFHEYSKDEKLCVTSIRTPGEAEALQQAGGVVIWVDADPKLRYQRVVSGARQRVTDQISYQEFLRQEAVEMTPTKEGGGLNQAAVRDRSDYTVVNATDTIEEFEAELQEQFDLTSR